MQKSTWTTVGILAAIIIILNLIIANIPGRFDLTNNKVYTMSSVTKTVLDNIQDPLTVKIYYSEKFPKQLITVQQYVFDLLNEYKNYAGSGLNYEFIEIGEGSEKEKQEAQGYGINPVQANISENDQFKVQQIFLGIAFLSGDKKEVLPFVQQVEQLEYDFTGAIKRLQNGGRTKIAYLTGSNEISITPANPYMPQEQVAKSAKMEKILAAVNEQYELVEVNIASTGIIPMEYSVAMWAEPSTEVGVKAKYAIDQFLMRGGHLGLFYNNNKIDFQSVIPVMPIRNGVSEFLNNYGIALNDNIVVDQENSKVQMMQRIGNFQIPVQVDYPFIPSLTKFDKENPIVGRLTQLQLFFPSSIDSVPGKNVKFTKLITTSDKSGYAMKDPQRNMYNPDPKQAFMYNQKHIIIAASVKGNFNSSFPSRPDSIVSTETHLTNSTNAGVILAVGDADFLKDEFQTPSGPEFLMNTIDWLIDENGLISIRSKKIEIKPLDKEILAEDASSKRDLIKFINVFLAPMLLIAFGIFRFLIRRKTKQLANLAQR